MTEIRLQNVGRTAIIAALLYAVAFLVVVNTVDLPSLDATTWLVIALAAVVQLGSVWFFGELFRHGIELGGKRIGGTLGFQAALVGSTVARLLPAGGAVTPVAMSWTVRREAPGAAGAAVRATALNYSGLWMGTGACLLWLKLRGRIEQWQGSVVVAASIAVVLGVVLMAAATRLGTLRRRLPNWIRRRVSTTMVDAPVDLRSQIYMWGRLLAEAMVLALVLAGFRLDVTPVEAAAAFGISQLASGIPGTPGGVGFAEAGLVGALALYGYPAAEVVAPILVFRIVSYWLPAGAGLVAGSRAFLASPVSVTPMSVSFNLPDQDGNPVSSEDFAGRRLIMFFYPKAMTPGCTMEACDFRDSYQELLDGGYAIVGVSPDEPDRNAEFKKKEGLPFPLLSDQDHALAEKLGAWGTKKLYGKEVTGLIRSTFLISPEGAVERAYRNVKATGHVERLKKDLLPA
jgi:peroxiredoxin Q/BCP